MYKVHKFLFIFLMVLSTGFAFEEASQEVEMNQLTPIDLDQLEVNEEGMFTFVQGDWVELTALIRHEIGGYFGNVKVEEYRQTPAVTWPCPHCKTSNEFWRKTCKNCGKRPM